MTATTTATQVDRIDTARLRQLINEDPDVRILDVRTGGEFESVHIPGSYNVPLDTLREHAGDLADVSHPVVLVCQSGGRAHQAHSTLTDAGKHTLHILDGGMNAWVAAGGDVVRSASERWAMDRQVRLTAGAMIVLGLLASIFTPTAKWLAGAIGAGLFYSAVSNTCAMASLLGRLPYNRGKGCDIAGVLEEMTSSDG